MWMRLLPSGLIELWLLVCFSGMCYGHVMCFALWLFVFQWNFFPNRTDARVSLGNMCCVSSSLSGGRTVGTGRSLPVIPGRWAFAWAFVRFLQVFLFVAACLECLLSLFRTRVLVHQFRLDQVMAMITSRTFFQSRAFLPHHCSSPSHWKNFV